MSNSPCSKVHPPKVVSDGGHAKLSVRGAVRFKVLHYFISWTRLQQLHQACQPTCFVCHTQPSLLQQQIQVLVPHTPLAGGCHSRLRNVLQNALFHASTDPNHQSTESDMFQLYQASEKDNAQTLGSARWHSDQYTEINDMVWLEDTSGGQTH